MQFLTSNLLPNESKINKTTEPLLNDHLDNAEDNEHTACALQGVVFMDDELGWCIITNWGVDYAINIVYYTPVASTDPAADEHHASMFEILAY